MRGGLPMWKSCGSSEAHAAVTVPSHRLSRLSFYYIYRVHVVTFTQLLRPPRCVSTGPEVVRLAGMANERERERERSRSYCTQQNIKWRPEREGQAREA